MTVHLQSPMEFALLRFITVELHQRSASHKRAVWFKSLDPTRHPDGA